MIKQKFKEWNDSRKIEELPHLLDAFKAGYYKAIQEQEDLIKTLLMCRLWFEEIEHKAHGLENGYLTQQSRFIQQYAASSAEFLKKKLDEIMK